MLMSELSFPAARHSAAAVGGGVAAVRLSAQSIHHSYCRLHTAAAGPARY